MTSKSEVMLLNVALKKERVTLTVGRIMTFTDLLFLLQPTLNGEQRKVIKFTPKKIKFLFFRNVSCGKQYKLYSG
jgi:hypothetical protein